MPRKKYDELTEAANTLAVALKSKPDEWVMCRDMRHAWEIQHNFYALPIESIGRRIAHIGRTLQCGRCKTLRKETYIVPRSGARIERIGMSYEYPDSYQIPGVPRGAKPASIIQQEMYRRAMEQVAKAEAGVRETAS